MVQGRNLDDALTAIKAPTCPCQLAQHLLNARTKVECLSLLHAGRNLHRCVMSVQGITEKGWYASSFPLDDT